MSYCFGIDVGGTTVKMGFFKTDGTLLDKWEIPTRTENKGEAVLPDIAEAIKAKLEISGICIEDVIGIGIDIPAPVDANGVVQNTANLGWGYKEVTRELTELTGLPSVAGNDATIATLGEMWAGGGNGKQNVVMVTLGTGVGGGIIVDGKPIIGTNGAGGEIGHLCMNPDEIETCGCGNHGCLEQYCAAPGIARLARKRLARNADTSILRNMDANTIDAKAVFDALKTGDAVAEEIIEEFASYLGRGLAMISTVCDPSVIIVGGGVSKAGDILLEYIEKHYQKYAFFAHKNVEFSLAKLGNDAGIYGSAKMIIDAEC